MDRKELTGNIIYYAVVLLVWWLTTRDGPPLRLTFWYHVAQISQAIAYRAGRVGLASEHIYHHELERSRP